MGPQLLPLTTFALEQLKPLRELNKNAPNPFTSDGKRATVLTTLSVAVREVSDALKKSHKVPRFQQRDLRRTVETMLQKLGVDKEVRAHLLSHGRTRGVHGQHYERYDFTGFRVSANRASAPGRAAFCKMMRYMLQLIDDQELPA